MSVRLICLQCDWKSDLPIDRLLVGMKILLICPKCGGEDFKIESDVELYGKPFLVGEIVGEEKLFVSNEPFYSRHPKGNFWILYGKNWSQKSITQLFVEMSKDGEQNSEDRVNTEDEAIKRFERRLIKPLRKLVTPLTVSDGGREK